MVVPDAYGFKSVKWLKRVVLTNQPFANDSYANGNNDVDSWMKTSARIVSRPAKVKVGQPVPTTGRSAGTPNRQTPCDPAGCWQPDLLLTHQK